MVGDVYLERDQVILNLINDIELRLSRHWREFELKKKQPILNPTEDGLWVMAVVFIKDEFEKSGIFNAYRRRGLSDVDIEACWRTARKNLEL